MTRVVLTSSIDLAVAHGAVAEPNGKAAYMATCPAVLGRIGAGPCGSPEEALAELGDLIRLHEARQGSAAS